MGIVTKGIAAYGLFKAGHALMRAGSDPGRFDAQHEGSSAGPSPRAMNARTSASMLRFAPNAVEAAMRKLRPRWDRVKSDLNSIKNSNLKGKPPEELDNLQRFVLEFKEGAKNSLTRQLMGHARQAPDAKADEVSPRFRQLGEKGYRDIFEKASEVFQNVIDDGLKSTEAYQNPGIHNQVDKALPRLLNAYKGWKAAVDGSSGGSQPEGEPTISKPPEGAVRPWPSDHTEGTPATKVADLARAKEHKVTPREFAIMAARDSIPHFEAATQGGDPGSTEVKVMRSLAKFSQIWADQSSSGSGRIGVGREAFDTLLNELDNVRRELATPSSREDADLSNLAEYAEKLSNQLGKLQDASEYGGSSKPLMEFGSTLGEIGLYMEGLASLKKNGSITQDAS